MFLLLPPPSQRAGAPLIQGILDPPLTTHNKRRIFDYIHIRDTPLGLAPLPLGNPGPATV